MNMLYISNLIQIPEAELQENFIRASGPGGQNVNKVATAVQLRFNVEKTTAIDEDVKVRLKRLAGRRMSADGEIVIEAKRYREQEKNRADARERLAILIRKALEKPRMRRLDGCSCRGPRGSCEGLSTSAGLGFEESPGWSKSAKRLIQFAAIRRD